MVTCTRPDLAAAVSIFAQYNNCPAVAHWETVTRLFGTRTRDGSYDKGINYNDIDTYADSCWACACGSRIGYFFKIVNNLISWQSKTYCSFQSLSTCETKYVALTAFSKNEKYSNFSRQYGGFGFR